MLSVPMSCLKLKGDCAFSVAAPRLWGDLLVHIDVDSIKSSLKTHLFLWLLDQCNFTNQGALLLVFIFDCLWSAAAVYICFRNKNVFPRLWSFCFDIEI